MTVIQHLIVEEYGAYIGKHSERLQVTQKGKTMVQAPLLHLESVVIANQGISISADVVRECTERGIPIHFLSSTGTPYASLYSAGLTGTVATRRAQLSAFHDGRGLALALAFCEGKLVNQGNLLKYSAKYRKETDPPLYTELRLRAAEILDALVELDGIRRYPEVMEGTATVNDLRSQLLGLEGRGAERYWGAVRLLLPEAYSPDGSKATSGNIFPGRVGRGATDPFNSALNYGYGILYAQCERCLVLAGLDPYAGFIHVDRPGKPSLVLDFIEEFRQPVVDRTLIGLANKGVRFEQDEQHRLTLETRRMLAEKINERLDSGQVYEGKRHALRAVMQMQARHLATFLRSERAAYTPFQMTW